MFLPHEIHNIDLWEDELTVSMGVCKCSSLTCDWERIPLSKFVVDTFIGVIDKNGKEVYEKDYIKAIDIFGDNYDGYIKYVFPSFVICNKYDYQEVIVSHIERESFECEVIGNIHQDWEPLK